MRNGPLFELMTIGAGRFDRGQLCRPLAVKFAMAALAFTLTYRGMPTATGQNILMAGPTGNGYGRAHRLGHMGRMTTGAGRQLRGGVAGKNGGGEYLAMTAATDLGFRFDELVGMLAAVTVVAKPAFALGHLRMGLGHHLAVIGMAGIARLGLSGRQERFIGIRVKRGMAIGTALLGKRLVRKAESRRQRQIGMTGHTTGTGHLRRLRRRVMRRMTARARQVSSLGMGGKTAQGIDLIRVTRTAQGLLWLAQEGRLR